MTTREEALRTNYSEFAPHPAAWEVEQVHPNTVQVTIPSLAQYIGVARQAVDAVTENIHLSPDDRMAVRLAVGEACNNAVLHSNIGPDESEIGHVTVACRVLPDALEIDVANDGSSFHPSEYVVHHATMPEAMAEHGRGVPLMEMLMDSVEYLSDQGSTIVRLRKLRSGKAGIAMHSLSHDSHSSLS